jgi:DNA repair exonuclease SbcCD nuclease subunit
LALRDPDLAELIGGATRRTFERIIDLCLEEQVNALLIAGDLYDGNLRSMKTAAFLSRELRRLEQAEIRVFMIRGNHDSESTVTRYLDLPKNVHLFTGHGGVEDLAEIGIAIHGVSFAQHHAPASLLPKYRPPIAGRTNIGLLHTSLAGAAGHDDYAPCAVSDLVAHGFDYWALGHVHQRRIHAEAPYVIMPGMPQGRDIGESGAKSVTMVTVSDAAITLEERVVAIAEFHRAPVDLTDVGDWRDAQTVLRTAIEGAREAVQSDQAVLRLELQGRSPLGWRIRRDADLFEAEARETAEQIGNVWIDRIVSELQTPISDASGADPVAELETLMREGAGDGAFRTDADGFLQQLVRALPPELRDDYGTDQASTEKALQHLLADGVAEVVAALRAGDMEKEAI